ncbi:MAG TPA: hypothetical protein VFI44_14405 [Ornithinibacter sp.]|nr:hypothetical protein [Ornithinibacter sp.]
MSTTTDATRPAPGSTVTATPTTSTPTTSTPSTTGTRAWAWTGVAAGIAGTVGIGASMQIDAVYAASSAQDVVDRLSDQVPAILVFHTATMLAVVLLLVFAAGLRRRLADQLPSRSLLPDVAAAGLGLVAVAGLLGSGLTTEFVFAVVEPEARLVPEAAVVFGHWVGTIPWLWVGAGLAGVCVAVAALRHGAAARWLGWVGAVLGGLTLVLGVSPLQYMAGMTGPIWLVVTALGLALGDRVTRTHAESPIRA